MECIGHAIIDPCDYMPCFYPILSTCGTREKYTDMPSCYSTYIAPMSAVHVHTFDVTYMPILLLCRI